MTLVPAPGERASERLEQLKEQEIRLTIAAETNLRPKESLGKRAGKAKTSSTLERSRRLKYALRNPISIQASAAPSDVSELLHQAVSLAEKAGPTLGTALIAWLHGRRGRKVRIKFGDIEAEASSTREVERLLDRIEKLRVKRRGQ